MSPSRSTVLLISAMAVLGLVVWPRPAYAETATGESTTAEASTAVDEIKPEPYSPDEFPQWALDLRRADIVAFGSLPFTIFFVKTAIDTYRYAYYDWDRRYAPWPFKSAGAIEMDEDQRIAALVAACFSSVALAAIDHIIVRVKRNSRERAAQSRGGSTTVTERSGWPPTVDLPTQETPPGSPQSEESQDDAAPEAVQDGEP